MKGSCNRHIPCPPVIDCEQSEWSKGPSCGHWISTRKIITEPQNGGKACGPNSKAVFDRECPIDCEVSDFGPCSASCDGGTMRRTVKVFPKHGGKVCPALEAPCNTHDCKEDCVLSSWSSCSHSCGDKGVRTRKVEKPARGGGSCPSNLSEPCNRVQCPR